MANRRLSMRKIKEVLRLSYQGNLSARQVKYQPQRRQRISGAGQNSRARLALTRHFKRTRTGAETFSPAAHARSTSQSAAGL
jgi:hypothetical protein